VSHTLCLPRLYFFGLAQSPRSRVAQVGIFGAQAPIARLGGAAPAGLGRLALLPVVQCRVRPRVISNCGPLDELEAASQEEICGQLRLKVVEEPVPGL